MQPLYSIVNFGLANLNRMKTLSNDTSQLKIEKEFAWLMTIVLMIAGLPILKNEIVLILEKLYQLFIQHAIGN